jgi:hypothetical protein
VGTTNPQAQLDLEGLSSSAVNSIAGSMYTNTTLTNPNAPTGSEGLFIDHNFTTNISLSSNQTAAADHAGTYFHVLTAANGTTYNAGSTLRALDFLVQHQGSAAYPNIKGAFFDMQSTGTGGVTNMYGVQVLARNTGSGTIANNFGLEILNPINSGGGAFTNNAGLYIVDQTIGTNKSNLVLGGTGAGAIPTGTFSIYNFSANNNYFAGNLSIGTNNTSPLATLDVRPNSGTLAIASVSGKTSFASLVVDNSGVGDLFTASSSGLNRFVITQSGNVGYWDNVPKKRHC